MKRIIALVVLIMIITAAPVAGKTVKGQRVKCPACGDGKHIECPYWCGDRHMTPAEIQDFEIMEMGYSPEAVAEMSRTEKNKLTPWFTIGGKRK